MAGCDESPARVSIEGRIESVERVTGPRPRGGAVVPVGGSAEPTPEPVDSVGGVDRRRAPETKVIHPGFEKSLVEAVAKFAEAVAEAGSAGSSARTGRNGWNGSANTRATRPRTTLPIVGTPGP